MIRGLPRPVPTGSDICCIAVGAGLARASGPVGVPAGRWERKVLSYGIPGGAGRAEYLFSAALDGCRTFEAATEVDGLACRRCSAGRRSVALKPSSTALRALASRAVSGFEVETISTVELRCPARLLGPGRRNGSGPMHSLGRAGP